ncbi:Oidioi.mRNA.OKI2018_I69.XSR.g13695.t1.cds [Oikopleura dioica]|uniref:Oidioi.mRNA.OKI2018_I69.XSR.g13695.t1.cds n=1 Tax=Oikopleura dioica TaxID=34765 RepID=A0ABN7SCC8_OIKDI|nr:Oidioi.mRNA.OKI2018_I69.XSR.g13695.t1.cds [Oikopleura dioica]
MEAVQTPEQLADIVRKSHREVEEEENRTQGTSSSTGADSQVQAEKSKKNEFSDLGLDMSDEEEDEGIVEAANKDPSIDDDMEKCLKGLELSDEEEDEDEEGSENVDGKQARKEWMKKQKADLIEKIARAIHKNIMLTKREKEIDDEMDRLMQNRSDEIERRIEERYTCGTCGKMLDSVKGVPEAKHEHFCKLASNI